jgi:SAM-dependent methyltransferase
MKLIFAIALALLCLTPVTVHAAAPPSKDVSALLAPIIQKHDVPAWEDRNTPWAESSPKANHGPAAPPLPTPAATPCGSPSPGSRPGKTSPSSSPATKPTTRPATTPPSPSSPTISRASLPNRCGSLKLEIMDLAGVYKQQFSWRDWPTIFDALPALEGQLVLDLGCAVGDLTGELVKRGACVIGIDTNEELLSVARSRQLANAEFRSGDVRTLPDLQPAADGIWCSFTTAYFPNLPTVLTAWRNNLKPEGWIALTEIDDLFGHEPLSVEVKALFNTYADDALKAERYDFHMGRKPKAHLERAGFIVSKVFTLDVGANGRATSGHLVQSREAHRPARPAEGGAGYRWP